MAFDGEIAAFCAELSADRRICVEGVRRLVALSEDHVELRVPGRLLAIDGTGLKLRELAEGRAVFEGRIAAFSVTAQKANGAEYAEGRRRRPG